MSNLRILLVFFSWTGITKVVAEEIMRNISINNKVHKFEIQPIKKRRYITWLLLSLLPSLKVKIQPIINDLSNYDLLILGCPKWGLCSPPMNEYLNNLKRCEGRMSAVFITFGGYDERRYLLYLESFLKRKELHTIDKLAIRRSDVENGGYTQVIKSFCLGIEQIMHQKSLNQVQ